MGAIEPGPILTPQNRCNWMVAHLQRDPPSDGRLVGIAPANDREAWTLTQAGEMLYWLMGGSVLSQGNAVSGKNIDHVQPHHRGEADWQSHAIGENQKCHAERQGAPMGRRTIQVQIVLVLRRWR